MWGIDSLIGIKRYTGSFYKAIKIGKICIVEINSNIICRNPTPFKLESEDLYPCVDFIIPFNMTTRLNGQWGITVSGAASFGTDGSVGLFGGDMYSVTSTIVYLSN